MLHTEGALNVFDTGSISSLDDISFSPMGHQLSHQGSGFSIDMAGAADAEGGSRASEVNNNHMEFCTVFWEHPFVE